MLGSDEYGLAGDSVHVDAGTSLEIIEMDEAVFRDEVDDPVFFRDLHSDGEIVLSLRWKEDIYGLFGEGSVRRGVVDFDNVKLQAGEKLAPELV